jgi:hypothetical protein
MDINSIGGYVLTASQSPLMCYLILLVFTYYVFITIYSGWTKERPWPEIPLVTLDEKSSKDSWLLHGEELLRKGFESYNGPFQVLSGTGPWVVVRNRFADEIKNNKNLSFVESARQDFFPHYPGFGAVKFALENPTLVPDMIRSHLMPASDQISKDMVEESDVAIPEIFGTSVEWQTIKHRAKVSQLVARLFSRVFLGRNLCRDEEWLQIIQNYTGHAFNGARELRQVPWIVRPIMYWFLPTCKVLRNEYRKARFLIAREICRRERLLRQSFGVADKTKRSPDTISWFIDGLKTRKIDIASAQLSLSMGAIHATTEGIAQALNDLCERPEYIEPLREEALQVIGKHGWGRLSFKNLTLMDSFLKESQRHSRGLGKHQDKQALCQTDGRHSYNGESRSQTRCPV